MATNRAYATGDQLEVAPTAGPNATVGAGDPVIVNDLPGVALTDADDTIASSGVCTVQFDGVFELDVTGDNQAESGTAIAPGEIVYWDDDDTQLNADDTDGVRFGYALESVDSGSTTTIQVKVGY